MLSNEDKKRVWSQAKPIKGKDPKQYRQDPYGNTLKYSDYGTNKGTGWEIDHIKPKDRGGSDYISNLQALQTKTNREKGDSLVKKSRHNQ